MQNLKTMQRLFACSLLLLPLCLNGMPECLRTFEWQIRDHLAHHVLLNPVQSLKSWLYLKIRRPRLSDEFELFRLNGRSLYFETYKNVFPRAYLSLLYQKHLSYYPYNRASFSKPSEGFYFIATYGNKPVGYIHLGPLSYHLEDPSVLCTPSEILAMYVSEAYRSMGLGQSLLRAGLDYFKARGQMPTLVCARKPNRGAQVFYQRQGASWIQNILFPMDGLCFAQRVYLFHRIPQPFEERPSWLQEKAMINL